MEKNYVKGVSYAILSAVVFGATPLFATWAYDFGSNAMTLCFYRNAFVLPIFLIILYFRKVDLHVTKKEFLQLAAIGILFSATTTFFLYDSYNYIGVGLATTLHFLYPVFTVVLGFILFKEKIEVNRVLSIILAFLGVALASGVSDMGSLKGIGLAIASSITYASYLIALERSLIRNMDSMKAMFYMCLVNTFAMGILGELSKTIIYHVSIKAAGCIFIVAAANSLIAYVLLLKCVKYIGAGNAAIFSTLEPVVGVICGILILKEGVDFLKIISCLLIIIAVTIPIICDFRKSNKAYPLKK